MSDVCGCQKLFHQSADGVGVDAHAALFLHHVPLLVKLALHGASDASAFEVCPQLQPVRWHAPEVLRRVHGRRGVDADGAVLLCYLGELIWDDVLLRLGAGIVEHLLQLRQLRRVLSDPLSKLRVVGRIGYLDLGQRYFFGGKVGRSDRIRSLEGHVFKHVGQPAGTLWIVG